MIQRVQTIFWIFTIIFIVLFLGQNYDYDLGIKIFQEPKFSIFSTISILLNLFAIFTFRKRKRQIIFSTSSLLLLCVQAGILFYAIQQHVLSKFYLTFTYLALGIISNALGGRFTRQDIKLLENSSRLR